MEAPHYDNGKSIRQPTDNVSNWTVKMNNQRSKEGNEQRQADITDRALGEGNEAVSNDVELRAGEEITLNVLGNDPSGRRPGLLGLVRCARQLQK